MGLISMIVYNTSNVSTWLVHVLYLSQLISETSNLCRTHILLIFKIFHLFYRFICSINMHVYEVSVPFLKFAISVQL